MLARSVGLRLLCPTMNVTLVEHICGVLSAQLRGSLVREFCAGIIAVAAPCFVESGSTMIVSGQNGSGECLGATSRVREGGRQRLAHRTPTGPQRQSYG